MEKYVSFSRLNDVGVPYSRAHIHRLVNAGKFPKPIKFGEMKSLFLKSEIDAWIKSKEAAREVAA